MKIIQHPDTYLCEQCGFEYHFIGLAEYCENFKIQDCEIKVGESVLVESRYDGFFEEVVTKIEIQHNDVFDTVIDDNGNKTNMLDWFQKHKIEPHEWVIYTENEIEICKDGTTSNKWNLSEVIHLNNHEWSNDYKNIPEDCFVKVNDRGDIQIRRSGKFHYEKYWYNTKFLGWLKTLR